MELQALVKQKFIVGLLMITLKKERKVLYVLPEIALTTQIIKRLKTFFEIW